MGERPHYSILIEPLCQKDGGGFLATVPDLPGCMPDGETEMEAVLNVQDAIACWLEAPRNGISRFRSPLTGGRRAELQSALGGAAQKASVIFLTSPFSELP